MIGEHVAKEQDDGGHQAPGSRGQKAEVGRAHLLGVRQAEVERQALAEGTQNLKFYTTKFAFKREKQTTSKSKFSSALFLRTFPVKRILAMQKFILLFLTWNASCNAWLYRFTFLTFKFIFKIFRLN